jgi:hypothetical protein
MSQSLEQAVKSQRPQIVKTDLAHESGLGTAMHSKSGQASIQAYKVFKNIQDREEVLRPYREASEKQK